MTSKKRKSPAAAAGNGERRGAEARSRSRGEAKGKDLADGSSAKRSETKVEAIPLSRDELESLIEDAKFHARGGEIAHYIPELRLALEGKTGIAAHFVDGSKVAAGDSNRYIRDTKGRIDEKMRPKDDSFTIQSISKVFALLYVLERLEHEEVFKRVGKEPTGDPFNASPRVKQVGGLRIPYNPLINVGAILMSSLFRKAHRKSEPGGPFDQFMAFLSEVCKAAKPLVVDEAVFESERSTGHNNRALAWQMSADGIFHQERQPPSRSTGVDKLSNEQIKEEYERRVGEVGFVEEILDWYFRQCSVLVTCEHLANAAAILANGGLCPDSGKRILQEKNVRTVISLMSSCGMYDGSGQFAHDVGIPSKSGVGGGIMSVVPGKAGLATFAAPLDEQGNSVRGLYLLKELSSRHGLSVFDRHYETPRLKTFGSSEALHVLTERARNQVVPKETFKKADYIPELTRANATDTGMSICYIDQGKPVVLSGGDATEPFTLQSVSTLFALLYVLQRQGEGIVFEYVGKEPSGEPYDELKWQVLKKADEHRRVPFNPMINAGAIVLATMIPERYSLRREEPLPIHGPESPPVERDLIQIDDFLVFVKDLCGNNDIDINWEVFESERKTGFSNRSLTWKMNDKGIFDKLLMRHNLTVDSDVIEDILSVYIRMCSIEVTCEDLAKAAAVLANRGKLFDSERHLITPRNVAIATSMMTSSGLFDGSGEFAFCVGVPAKSGVSGGLVGFVPGQLGMAAYSPVVDDKGNSVRGQWLFQAVANDEHLSIFSAPVK